MVAQLRLAELSAVEATIRRVADLFPGKEIIITEHGGVAGNLVT